MIHLIPQTHFLQLANRLTSDSARVYFIRLGLLKSNVFQAVYAETDTAGNPQALLCLRRSGVLQFYAAGPYDVPGFAALIDTLKWTYLISPQACCASLMASECFGRVEPMAWIARLDHLKGGEAAEKPEILTTADLPEIDALYDRVFDHYMPLVQMQEKLQQNRGRGVVIHRDGKIAAVAQSEFEAPDNALIVGVATAPEHRQQGLAESCLRCLCSVLSAEGKTLWLQYDNPEAGRLYEKLGFQVADRVMYCWRK